MERHHTLQQKGKTKLSFKLIVKLQQILTVLKLVQLKYIVLTNQLHFDFCIYGPKYLIRLKAAGFSKKTLRL